MSREPDPTRSTGSTRAGVGWFCAFALGVVLLLHPTLDQPPVWDTSTGLFPAAFTLAGNGFDLPDLLAQPGWAHGGPNIHPFSSVTWGTAAVLWAQPERAIWLPLLHLLHFAMAAGTLLGVFRLASGFLPRPLALATAGVLLLWPLFQVQVGYLYTEMPLALCTVWAVRCHALRRFGWAAVWSALACSVKEAGLVVPVALAAAVALEPGAPRQRVLRLLPLALPAAFFVALHLGIAIPVEEVSGVRPLSYADQLRDIGRKLAMLPDLVAIGAVFVAVGLASLPESLRELRAERERSDPALRVRALALLVAAAFAGFYLLVPLTAVEVYVLPRYYVQLLPLVLLCLVFGAQRRGGRRAVATLLALLAVFFVANRRGEFLGLYPPVPGNEFSLAERSLEYRDLLAAQRDLLEAAAGLPPELPVFYGLPEHFLYAWPQLGYAAGPPPNGHCIWLERHERSMRLSDHPPRFAILYNFVGYGGGWFQALIGQARRDPAYRVRSTVFERGRYRTVLFEVGPAPGRS